MKQLILIALLFVGFGQILAQSESSKAMQSKKIWSGMKKVVAPSK